MFCSGPDLRFITLCEVCTSYFFLLLFWDGVLCLLREKHAVRGGMVLGFGR